MSELNFLRLKVREFYFVGTEQDGLSDPDYDERLKITRPMTFVIVYRGTFHVTGKIPEYFVCTVSTLKLTFGSSKSTTECHEM